MANPVEVLQQPVAAHRELAFLDRRLIDFRRVHAERCKLLTTTLVTREATGAPNYARTVERETAMLRDFHVEDMQANAAVQHGLRSQRVVRGWLSHLEEPIWLMQRFLAACLRRAPASDAREAAA